MTALHSSRLDCDVCGAGISWPMTVSATQMRLVARKSQGWRRDKDGRDVCAAHPKRKGTR